MKKIARHSLISSVLALGSYSCVTPLKFLEPGAQWRKIETPEKMGALTYPSCVGAGDLIHTVGGIQEGEPNASNTQGFTYNLDTESWTQWPAEKGPFPRQHFALANTSRGVLLFGGDPLKGPEGLLSDAYLFQPDTNSWKALPGSKVVDPRAKATATQVGDHIVIYGGNGKKDALNVGVLNFKTLKWSQIPAPEGIKSRVSHVAVGDQESLFVWGGFEKSKRMSDGFLFTPKTKTWKPVPATPILNSRANSRAVIDAGKVFILGGAGENGSSIDGAIYDIKEASWSRLPPITATGVEDLKNFEIVAIPKRGFVVWGGRHGTGSFNNRVFFFDFDSGRWNEIKASNPPPASMAGCLGLAKGQVFQLGGIGLTEGEQKSLTHFDGLWLLNAY